MKTSRGLGSNSKHGGPTRLTLKGVPICGDAGVHWNTPPWKCKAFKDIRPQVRDQIIETERCGHLSAAWKDKVCSAKGTARKQWRRAPECKGGHGQWLPEIFSSKSVKVNFKPDEKSG